MYFAKVTAFSLFGAAMSAPLTRVVKRDVAGDIAGAFTGLQGTLAPMLEKLTNDWNGADKSSNLDTFNAIREDIYDIGDAIDDLQHDFTDMDTQDGADITASVDAATATFTDVFNAFRPITEYIDDNKDFDILTYGTMNGLGLQIGGTINIADVRLDGGLRDALSANLGSFADVADQVPGVGIAIDTDSDDDKKRSLNARAPVDDIAAAFKALQSDVAGPLKDLAAAWEGADKSSNLKTWQAISKPIYNVDAKVTTAADAVVRAGDQDGADAKVVVEAATAAYLPIVQAFAPISAKIESDSAFKALAYGSMSSMSTKMLSAATTSDYHFGGSAVVDGLKSGLSDVKDALQGFPALIDGLF